MKVVWHLMKLISRFFHTIFSQPCLTAGLQNYQKQSHSLGGMTVSSLGCLILLWLPQLCPGGRSLPCPWQPCHPRMWLADFCTFLPIEIECIHDEFWQLNILHNHHHPHPQKVLQQVHPASPRVTHSPASVWNIFMSAGYIIPGVTCKGHGSTMLNLTVNCQRLYQIPLLSSPSPAASCHSTSQPVFAVSIFFTWCSVGYGLVSQCVCACMGLLTSDC